MQWCMGEEPVNKKQMRISNTVRSSNKCPFWVPSQVPLGTILSALWVPFQPSKKAKEICKNFSCWQSLQKKPLQKTKIVKFWVEHSLHQVCGLQKEAQTGSLGAKPDRKCMVHAQPPTLSTKAHVEWLEIQEIQCWVPADKLSTWVLKKVHLLKELCRFSSRLYSSGSRVRFEVKVESKKTVS